MSPLRLTRRTFLATGGTLAAGALTLGRAVAQPAPGGAASARVVYRLSVRGRRGSNAAKLHAANMRFATAGAAAAGRAHPGDNSRIVPIVVSADEFDRLFASRHSEVADLRSLGGPAIVGDCNRNGIVAINELIVGVRIALGDASVTECLPFDRGSDGRVSINELIRGVGNALRIV